MIKALRGSDGAFMLIRGLQRGPPGEMERGRNRRVKGILGGWHPWRPLSMGLTSILSPTGKQWVF